TADAEQAKGSTVQFVGVDTLDPKSSAIPFVDKAGITYPVATDNGQVSSGLYGLYGDPQTFFLDAEGTVIGHVRGALNQVELRQWLHRLGGSAGDAVRRRSGRRRARSELRRLPAGRT